MSSERFKPGLLESYAVRSGEMICGRCKAVVLTLTVLTVGIPTGVVIALIVFR